jgi:hypothetical protein
MSVLDNFDSWKDFLGDRLHQAQGKGMENSAVSGIAYEIGDYLATKVEAKNTEEKILRDLWTVASQDEKQAIANMMVKLVQDNGHTR